MLEIKERKRQSRYLKEFIETIKFQNRNPKDLTALQLLDETLSNPTVYYRKGDLLFRSRIFYKRAKGKEEPGFFGYNSKDSFVPPWRKAGDLRANYRFIPYLYCSNRAYVSVAEVRPSLGSLVSVATIEVLEELKLLDFTNYQKKIKMTLAKASLFDDLSQMFSEPVTNDDDIIDYIPTQFIAEYAKNLGYDGIIYKSSIAPEIYTNNLDGFNVVVFNYTKCKPIKSNVFRVDRIYYECCQVDDDNRTLSILSPLEERLISI